MPTSGSNVRVFVAGDALDVPLIVGEAHADVSVIAASCRSRHQSMSANTATRSALVELPAVLVPAVGRWA